MKEERDGGLTRGLNYFGLVDLVQISRETDMKAIVYDQYGSPDVLNIQVTVTCQVTVT
jgi:hypothetical protein